MTETEGQPDSGRATAGGNVLRRNSDDVGWEFGVLVNEQQGPGETASCHVCFAFVILELFAFVMCACVLCCEN